MPVLRWNTSYIADAVVLNFSRLDYGSPTMVPLEVPEDPVVARWVSELAGGLSAVLVSLVIVLVLVRRNLVAFNNCLNAIKATFSNTQEVANDAGAELSDPPSHSLDVQMSNAGQQVTLSTDGVAIYRNDRLVAVCNPAAERINTRM